MKPQPNLEKSVVPQDIIVGLPLPTGEYFYYMPIIKTIYNKDSKT